MPVTANVSVNYPAHPGITTTWGMPAPSGAEGRLTSVELLGVANLEIVGVLGCASWTSHPDGSRIHCAPTTANGWPPAGVTALPVEGLALPGNPDQATGILVGVRRLTSESPGSIAAVRLWYESGGRTYQVVQPWSLTLVQPSS
jgi:hypothetical protein